MTENDIRVIEKIIIQPRFKELVQRRSRLSLTLTILVLSAYISLITLVSFAPETLAKPLNESTSITFAVLYAVFVIVFGAIMTGFYVRRANSELDDLSDYVVKEAMKC